MTVDPSGSVTIKNLETAFAGDAMAHIKHLYFARLAREAGAENIAKSDFEMAEL